MAEPLTSSPASSRFWFWALTGATALGVSYVAYKCIQLTKEEAEDEPEQPQPQRKPAAAVPAPARPSAAAQTAAAAASAAAAAEAAPVVLSDAAAAAASSDASAVHACDHCQQASANALRCSKCKTVWYCNRECQKKAWPGHKRRCNQATAAAGDAAGKANANGAAADLTSTSAAANGPSSAAGPHLPVGGAAAAALEAHLAQAAASKTDPLDAVYETAVLNFVRADYRTAIGQFTEARALAEAAGRSEISGDALRWLGHCHQRLGDSGKAAAHFAEGCAAAQSSGNAKLEVDCLNGLGCLYRNENDSERAVVYLKQALGVAESLGAPVACASVLSNLGAALAASDPAAAVATLEKSVMLREQEIVRMDAAGERNGLASAIMEHAASLVNYASALYTVKRFPAALEAYEQALQVFELVEDVDKVTKVLVNLANLSELQLAEPEARQAAAAYRRKLYAFVQEHTQRSAPEACAVCLDPLAVAEASPEGAAVIVLGCYHAFHNGCWEAWQERAQASACPSCKAPVTVVEAREIREEGNEANAQEID